MRWEVMRDGIDFWESPALVQISFGTRAGATVQTFPNASQRLVLQPGSVDGTTEPCARPEKFACLWLIRVWLMPFWALGRRGRIILILEENEQIN